MIKPINMLQCKCGYSLEMAAKYLSKDDVESLMIDHYAELHSSEDWPNDVLIGFANKTIRLLGESL